MLKPEGRSVKSASLYEAMQIPGLGAIGPRLVTTKDSGHDASELVIVTHGNVDYLWVNYRGQAIEVPMTSVRYTLPG